MVLVDTVSSYLAWFLLLVLIDVPDCLTGGPVGFASRSVGPKG